MLSSVLVVAACLTANIYVAANPLFQSSNATAVPVELFVMSKCPDAVRCESTFAKVFNQISVPVSLDINFIAQPAPFEPLKFTCKHGPSECYGNMQELCYRHVHGEETWFSFIQCLNEDLPYIGTDKLGASCAKKQGKSYDIVKDCLEDGTAIKLHAKSVERTGSMGVSTSCTVYIDQKRRCIHDGGEWRDCPGGSSVNDFVKSIEDAFRLSEGSTDPRFTVQSNQF
ncbi:hypothetical protein BGW37DRAFT_487838 [Umbelopsis sp. PMI_123]|nr:hypothetical protein BGW37DRAFT_487838 [Umbelopsis sp. PMI_123]